MFIALVKHDFKGDPEIDAIIRDNAGDNKSAFFKAAIKSYVQSKEKPQELQEEKVNLVVEGRWHK